MCVLQLLDCVRPYSNQTNEDAMDGACGEYVEKEFFEMLVEKDYLLDLRVLKNSDESRDLK